MQIEANNYTIAVLGSGTMGQGIAQIAGTAGHPVLLLILQTTIIMQLTMNLTNIIAIRNPIILIVLY